ncbi:hypothetical protein [Streptomyces sp. NPDC057386]|uniref:hypothetical protein n=1 Tax=unclassified Streptomyces TaxID=2593676 RepID=UPI0036296C10
MTRTAAVAPAENSTFEGPEPGRIVVQDTLMQDMVLGAELVVSAFSEYPVATFENFLAEGGNAQREGRAHEALVVVDPKDSDRRLLHVRGPGRFWPRPVRHRPAAAGRPRPP